jgi:hypothetical protein
VDLDAIDNNRSYYQHAFNSLNMDSLDCMQEPVRLGLIFLSIGVFLRLAVMPASITYPCNPYTSTHRAQATCSAFWVPARVVREEEGESKSEKAKDAKQWSLASTR